MTDHISLRIALLDVQILDADKRPLGRVDDLELEHSPGSDAPRVVAILTGAEALGEVLGGTLGHWMSRAAARLRPADHPAGPARIEVGLVAELEPMIRLRRALRDLEHIAALERWLARNLIEPLPGAGDARD